MKRHVMQQLSALERASKDMLSARSGRPLAVLDTLLSLERYVSSHSVVTDLPHQRIGKFQEVDFQLSSSISR